MATKNTITIQNSDGSLTEMEKPVEPPTPPSHPSQLIMGDAQTGRTIYQLVGANPDGSPIYRSARSEPAAK